MKNLSLLALPLAALLTTGCTSDYARNSSAFQESYAAGDYAGALAAAEPMAAAAEPNDAVILKLQLGTIQRSAGMAAAAAKTFEEAEGLFSAYDAKPEVSLSAEGVSAFSNPYALAYRGRAYDRTMAASYQALTFLQAGDGAKARVAMNRALFRQEDAKRLSAEKARIANEEGKAAAKADSRTADAVNHKAVLKASSASRALLADVPAYNNYVNPFTSWLHGIFFLHRAEGASDVEKARKSLELAAAMVPRNTGIAADLADAAAGRARPSTPGQTTVYVVHESGRAPTWKENKFTFPFILVDQSAPIVSVALPELHPVPDATELVASYGGKEAKAELLLSVDALAAQDFKDEYPVVRNRAIASATVKGIAAYIANKAAREAADRNNDGSGGFVMLATLIATNVYTTQSAQADLRHWSTLPKNISLARMTVPSGSMITLRNSLGTPGVPVLLPAGKAVILSCKTPANGGAVTVQPIILN
jgi:hypothetical protein